MVKNHNNQNFSGHHFEKWDEILRVSYAAHAMLNRIHATARYNVIHLRLSPNIEVATNGAENVRWLVDGIPDQISEKLLFPTT